LPKARCSFATKASASGLTISGNVGASLPRSWTPGGVGIVELFIGLSF